MDIQLLDVTKLRRAERPYHLGKFPDPNLSEPLEIALRRLLANEEAAAETRAETYVSRYVSGGWRSESGDWMPKAIDFVMPDGSESPVLNSEILYQLARIEAMQPPAQRYSVDALVILTQTAPDAWVLVERFAKTVQYGLLDAKADAGKASPDPSETP